jgi:hypothetical protein
MAHGLTIIGGGTHRDIGHIGSAIIGGGNT